MSKTTNSIEPADDSATTQAPIAALTTSTTEAVTDQEARDTVPPAWYRRGEENTKTSSSYDIPLSIRKRFLQAEGRFHFRDAKHANKVAFSDLGRKLVTEHDDPDIATAMVDVAIAKGWGELKVTGTDEFRREVWLQATLKNLAVNGYEPKEVDMARLAEARNDRSRNRIEHVGAAVSRPVRADPVDLPLAARRTASADAYDFQKTPEAFSGKLVAFGVAHVDFDPLNGKDYFVKIQTSKGMRIHWGQGLEATMGPAVAAGLKLGDDVSFAPVDAKGLGLAATATSLRHSEPDRTSISEHAGPTGQYQAAADVIGEVLRANGYSPKTISRVLEESHRRLDAMQLPGASSPAATTQEQRSASPAARTRQSTRERDRAIEPSR